MDATCLLVGLYAWVDYAWIRIFMTIRDPVRSSAVAICSLVIDLVAYRRTRADAGTVDDNRQKRTFTNRKMDRGICANPT